MPEVGAGDVLVRVHAAALNPADWHILRGDPLVARLMGVGLTRPKARVAGIDAAGVVEAAGASVRGIRNGDQVLGFSGARSRSTRAPRPTWWCPSQRPLPSSRRPQSPSRRRRRCAGSATWAR